MIKLLEKIFRETKYEVEAFDNDIIFSYKEEEEYFLSVSYTEDEALEFFECDKTKKIFKLFEYLKSDQLDVKKNTSVFVCIKVDDIEEFNISHKNLIFSIEEDEYFFRKYVIVYSESSIKKLNINKEIVNQIHDILICPNRIDEFKDKYYKDEEFFVAMQLMIKLPFLVFKTEKEKLESLQDKIYEKIKDEKLNKFFERINNLEDSCRNKDINEYFKELEASFLAEGNNDEILNRFLNNFEEDNL